MPADLTIFAAKYLVFIEALLAVAFAAFTLYQRPRHVVARWIAAAAIILVLSYVLGKIGSAVYSDPRPFSQDHVKPLIPHAPDNGFPSDHALLAAACVAVVAFIRRAAALSLALVLAVLAVLVEWARVGAGIHHVIDVIGSDAFVLLATLVALAVTPFIAHRLDDNTPFLRGGSHPVGG